jgi:purine-nucleoside phosphorylase
MTRTRSDDPFEQAVRAARVLAEVTKARTHDIYVALGSGWAAAADLLPTGSDVSMDSLPGFATPSALGHRNVLRSLELDGRRVLLGLGRVHLYEGHGPAAVTHAVRTAVAAGCRTVVLTNACGSMRPEWPIGAPVLLADQINFTGVSPMPGPPPPTPWPGRFVPLGDLYSTRLRAIVRAVEPDIPEGIYVGFHGPEFETPAEIRMARAWGGDLVGMSTVLEAIAGRHMGAEILGLGLVTNLAAGMSEIPLDGEHVIAVAAQAAPRVADLLQRVLKRL